MSDWKLLKIHESIDRVASVTGGQGALVVLLLKANRVPGHHLFCAEEEEQSDHFPARVPPCVHVQHLVVCAQLDPLRPE